MIHPSATTWRCRVRDSRSRSYPARRGHVSWGALSALVMSFHLPLTARNSCVAGPSTHPCYTRRPPARSDPASAQRQSWKSPPSVSPFNACEGLLPGPLCPKMRGQCPSHCFAGSCNTPPEITQRNGRSGTTTRLNFIGFPYPLTELPSPIPPKGNFCGVCQIQLTPESTTATGERTFCKYEPACSRSLYLPI
jgi:hypothetical protein